MQTVIYCRRSSEQGDNRNLERQESDCRRYAESHGLVVSSVVAHNFTGTVHLRDRHRDLWQLIEDRQIGTLIVQQLDRLSRADLLDALTLIRDINARNCAVYSADIGLIDTNDITAIIKSWVSGVDRINTVKRLMENKLLKAAKGWVGSGPTPYGYIKTGQGKTAQLIIDEPRAAVVRWMFETYAGGATLRGIESELNQRGVPSPNGGLWRGPGSVQAILHRPVYCGRITFGGVCVVDESVRITTVEVYERVQDRLRYNIENSRRNTQSIYIMRGFVTCYCGHRMGISSKQYKCDALSYPRGHPNRCVGSIHISRVDALVTEYIRWAITPDVIQRGIEEKERQVVAQLQTRSVADIDGQIEKLKKRIDRLYTAFGDGDDDAKSHIADDRLAISALEAERSHIINAETTAQSRRAARESITAHVARLRGRLDNPAPQLLRDLAEVMSVRAQLRRDETGARALVISSEVVGEVVYEL